MERNTYDFWVEYNGEMIQSKSFLEVLSTPEAQEAFVIGLITAMRTRNLEAGLSALIAKAAENGALREAGTAAIQELLRWIWEALQERKYN